MNKSSSNEGNWDNTKILQTIEEIQHAIKNNLQRNNIRNLTYEIRNINSKVNVKLEFDLYLRGEENKCIFCLQHNHNIQHCSNFLKSNEKSRTLIAERLNLCYKCLMKHRKNECESQNCPNCKGPHNILLCYKRKRE